jgi:hypothetical protein
VRMQRAGRALGGAEGAGDAGGRDSSAFEPGLHRSVYERAFGPLGDVGFDHGRVPAPWPQHSDMFDEHEHEEMLYRRQMALAAQDRARSVPLSMWVCARAEYSTTPVRPCAPARPRHHAFVPDTPCSRPSACENACAQKQPRPDGSSGRADTRPSPRKWAGAASPTTVCPQTMRCTRCTGAPSQPRARERALRVLMARTGSPHARLSALTLARARKSRGADSLLALGGHAGRTTRP